MVKTTGHSRRITRRGGWRWTVIKGSIVIRGGIAIAIQVEGTLMEVVAIVITIIITIIVRVRGY